MATSAKPLRPPAVRRSVRLMTRDTAARTVSPEETAMTTTTTSVFDAGLPMLGYDIDDEPAAAWSHIRDAQRVAPIGIGPAGPEILSYEYARAILRDPRF